MMFNTYYFSMFLLFFAKSCESKGHRNESKFSLYDVVGTKWKEIKQKIHT